MLLLLYVLLNRTKSITLTTGHQISIGITKYSDDTQAIDSLMILADQALYIDKRN